MNENDFLKDKGRVSNLGGANVYIQNKKFELLVEGYGLKEVMRTPGIDFENTKTNHVTEMEEVLGIEAARQTIIEEMNKVMGSYGISIDIRHMGLLADVMTFKGKVLAINRHGVDKMKNSVLMKASFEQTPEHLYSAAVHAKEDGIHGVSECIITGNQVSLGTGGFKICQDDTKKPSQKVLSKTKKQYQIADNAQGNVNQRKAFIENYALDYGPR